MSLDETINSSLALLRNAPSDLFFTAVSASIVFAIVALLFYLWKKNFLVCSQIALGGAITYAIVEVLKQVVLRPRPDGSDSFSFPSSHAALAFFLAFVIPVNKKYKMALLAWAVLVGFSRLWLGLHWFTDVLASAVIGIIVAYLIKQEYIKKEIEKTIKKILERVRR